MYRGWLPIADPEKKYRYGERERLPPPPPCITVFRLAAPRPCVFCIFSPPSSLPCFALTRFLFFFFFFDFHSIRKREFWDIYNPSEKIIINGELISRLKRRCNGFN